MDIYPEEKHHGCIRFNWFTNSTNRPYIIHKKRRNRAWHRINNSILRARSCVIFINNNGGNHIHTRAVALCKKHLYSSLFVHTSRMSIFLLSMFFVFLQTRTRKLAPPFSCMQLAISYLALRVPGSFFIFKITYHFFFFLSSAGLISTTGATDVSVFSTTTPSFNL